MFIREARLFTFTKNFIGGSGGPDLLTVGERSPLLLYPCALTGKTFKYQNPKSVYGCSLRQPLVVLRKLGQTSKVKVTGYE